MFTITTVTCAFGQPHATNVNRQQRSKLPRSQRQHLATMNRSRHDRPQRTDAKPRRHCHLLLPTAASPLAREHTRPATNLDTDHSASNRPPTRPGRATTHRMRDPPTHDQHAVTTSRLSPTPSSTPSAAPRRPAPCLPPVPRWAPVHPPRHRAPRYTHPARGTAPR